jgi:hypothetical protein
MYIMLIVLLHLLNLIRVWLCEWVRCGNHRVTNETVDLVQIYMKFCAMSNSSCHVYVSNNMMTIGISGTKGESICSLFIKLLTIQKNRSLDIKVDWIPHRFLALFCPACLETEIWYNYIPDRVARYIIWVQPENSGGVWLPHYLPFQTFREPTPIRTFIIFLAQKNGHPWCRGSYIYVCWYDCS